ncbi:MAG: iron dependent repressor, metal binding and dimerization domain protein [Pirellulales bacterium]
MKTLDKSTPHEKTRSAHKLETTEDYLEAIAEAIDSKGVCRSADLVKRFAVSAVTVHKIVDRLRAAALVAGEPYQPILLTDQGRAIATKSKERHRIVFDFLLAIGLDEATAAIDSEGMEHHVSAKTLELLKKTTSKLVP